MDNLEKYNKKESSSAEEKDERLRSLEYLVESEGYFEQTPEMEQLREEITEIPGEKYDAWRDLAEEEADASEDYIKAQIGLLITEAAIYLEAGYEEFFREQLNDIIEYALVGGFDNIVHSLRDLLKP